VGGVFTLLRCAREKFPQRGVDGASEDPCAHPGQSNAIWKALEGEADYALRYDLIWLITYDEIISIAMKMISITGNRKLRGFGDYTGEIRISSSFLRGVYGA
jgi:hypothetical protein